MIIHTVDGVIRPRVAVTRHVPADTWLDEAIALRRCTLYRRAFRGLAVSCPADALRLGAVARWIRSHGVAVDIASTDDLERVRQAEIHASYVVMHCHGEVSIPLRRAALASFVVDRVEQLTQLGDNPLARTQHVVVDAERADELVAEALAHRRLEVVGLHTRIGNIDVDALSEAVVTTVGRMAWIRRRHGVLLSQVSLGDVEVPEMHDDLRSARRVARVIDQAIEDGCIRFRYPRPTVKVSPRRSLIVST